jgi:tryptophan-rich sensory protein
MTLSFSAAAAGVLLAPGVWYETLRKPSWTPPSWVFGPVWSALYGAMAVAAWLVWQRGGLVRQWRALTWWAVQLVLNAAWTPLFFGLRRLDIAFAEIVLLWGAIAMTTAAFRRVSRVAEWLLAPYLAWVSFAAALNLSLWRLNS